MNTENKSTELENTDKKLHISDVKSMHGDTYIRQEIIESGAVFDALRERIEGK